MILFPHRWDLILRILDHSPLWTLPSQAEILKQRRVLKLAIQQCTIILQRQFYLQKLFLKRDPKHLLLYSYRHPKKHLQHGSVMLVWLLLVPRMHLEIVLIWVWILQGHHLRRNHPLILIRPPFLHKTLQRQLSNHRHLMVGKPNRALALWILTVAYFR